MKFDRPFVDSPVGDLNEATAAAEIAAQQWGLAQPAFLRSGMNALFVSGKLVLRVGRTTVAATSGLELAHRLHDIEIPTALPARDDAYEIDELSVTAWHLIELVNAPTDWVEVGRICRRVHELQAADLPASYPLPSPVTFPWWNFESLLFDAAGIIDDEAFAGLSAAVERNLSWSQFDRTVVCHGDVHPGNVLMTRVGPVLIDWDLMCLAPAGWDHAMLLTIASRWGGPTSAYPDFAQGYGYSLADQPKALQLAELRNVAATLMRVLAAQSDPASRLEASQRLRHWRGEANAPSWNAV